MKYDNLRALRNACLEDAVSPIATQLYDVANYISPMFLGKKTQLLSQVYHIARCSLGKKQVKNTTIITSTA